MNTNLSIENLYNQGLKHFELNNYIEAEKHFHDVITNYALNINNKNYNPYNEEFYGNFKSAINKLSLFIYPNEKAINTNKVLNFYKHFSETSDGYMGFCLAIFNGIFDHLPADERPKVEIEKVLKMDDNGYEAYCIAKLIDLNQFQYENMNSSKLFYFAKYDSSGILKELLENWSTEEKFISKELNNKIESFLIQLKLKLGIENVNLIKTYESDLLNEYVKQLL
jgi:hypothetical protein